MKRIPVTVFSEWAESGRDGGMAKGHEAAVANMLDFALKDSESYSVIDAGCGNGWVVRQLKSLEKCTSAIGVDGAVKMIEKARSIDKEGTYHHADLSSWKPGEKVDIVHSMEVIYYLTNPESFIKQVFENWLKEKGRLIVGLDFYTENTVSHTWPEDCGVSIMHLFSEKEWVSFFKNAGFKSIQSWRVNAKENWAGTLVITGLK